MSSIVAKRYYDNYVSMADEDNLAPEKLAELKNCFGSFDRNGDGTISANEFQNALIRMNIYIPADVQFSFKLILLFEAPFLSLIKYIQMHGGHCQLYNNLIQNLKFMI